MQKLSSCLALIFVLFCAMKLSAQKVTQDEAMAQVAKGKQFTFIILRKGDTPLPADPKALGPIHMAHLVNLFQLEKDGKISIFGPVLKDSTMEGIIIWNSTNREEIRRELMNDAYIKAGYMKFDMYDWFTIPGQKIRE